MTAYAPAGAPFVSQSGSFTTEGQVLTISPRLPVVFGNVAGRWWRTTA